LTRRNPENDIKNWVNYYVADEHVARSLYSIDKAFHPHPAGKRYWQTVVASEETKLVHFAMHIKTRLCLGYLVTQYTGKSAVNIERMLVIPEYRRIKVGTRLLLRCIADMPPGIHKLAYVVPEGDLDTQLFLKATGFKARLPIKENHFPDYQSVNGIRFTWDEAK
jgi:GNAT superfamily N-acetyltransferase